MQLANAVKTARVGRRNQEKPQAAFMFMGPSGVGKTEIAKALAEALLDDEKALTRFDMSEYMEKHAVSRLIGAPPGYEGFEAGGILTNAMRKNPLRVLLFDEIEKAHPDVFNVFLQILSDGRLTDNVGRTVSFSESIIIMTTNIGQPHFLNPRFHLRAGGRRRDGGGRQDLSLGIPQPLRRPRRTSSASTSSIWRRSRRSCGREFDNMNQTYSQDGVNDHASRTRISRPSARRITTRRSARAACRASSRPTVEPIIVNMILDGARKDNAALIYKKDSNSLCRAQQAEPSKRESRMSNLKDDIDRLKSKIEDRAYQGEQGADAASFATQRRKDVTSLHRFLAQLAVASIWIYAPHRGARGSGSDGAGPLAVALVPAVRVDKVVYVEDKYQNRLFSKTRAGAFPAVSLVFAWFILMPALVFAY